MLQTAQTHGLVFNSNKCEIGVTKVKFFGNVYSQSGISPDPDKVRDLRNCQTPASKNDLQRFLGFIQFLAPFIPNLSEKAAPLRDLLKEDAPWTWDEDHTHVFECLKQIISEDTGIQFYNMAKPVQLHCDASARGIGACLMQPQDYTGTAFRPIAYASKSLTPTEQNYSNLERELLTIVFGIERFNTYLSGRYFTIVTDHHPLVAISTKDLMKAPPRVQRLLIRLQGYDFRITYKPGAIHTIPDWLSRSPNHQNKQTIPLDVRVDFIAFTDEKLQELKVQTMEDSTLTQLTQQIVKGWPDTVKDVIPDLKTYWDCRDELTVENGLILKGCRVVIPTKLRNNYMSKLHMGHMGITKTQLRARDTIFWPRINQDIKNTVGSCHVCQKYQASQTKEPFIPHDVPLTPWTKLGSDLFYLNNRQYLITTDYTTKYAVRRQLPSSAPSSVIVKVLKTIMSELGIPRELVSDRGPHFSSHEFRNFCSKWGIKHTCSSPTYAQSNGAVERAIQTVKSIMKKAIETNEDPELALLAWRGTPLDGNTKSPAELLFGRKVLINLPVKADPIPEETIEARALKQARVAEGYNHHSRPLAPLQQHTHVMYQDATTWKPGIITNVGNHTATPLWCATTNRFDQQLPVLLKGRTLQCIAQSQGQIKTKLNSTTDKQKKQQRKYNSIYLLKTKTNISHVQEGRSNHPKPSNGNVHHDSAQGDDRPDPYVYNKCKPVDKI